MKKFIIEELEKKRILGLHKSLLKEQVNRPTGSSKDQLQELIVKGCFPKSAEVKPTSGTYPKDYAVKVKSTSNPGRYRLYFIDKTTVQVDINGESKYLPNPWTCKVLNSTVTPTLTPQQQKSVDDIVNFYKSEDGSPLYTKQEPTSDQMAKQEWKKTNLKDEEAFEDIIKFDYFVWKKTGKRQTKGPQQEAIIKLWGQRGFMDKGGVLNPADADKYSIKDLKDFYPTEFPKSYILVQSINTVDVDTLIKELNKLVKTRKYNDRRICKEIINNYKVAKEKNAYADDPTIENWKIAINACDSNKLNYNDLGITRNTITKLKTPAPVDDTDTTTVDGESPKTPKRDKWAIQ